MGESAFQHKQADKTENLESWWCCCLLTEPFSISGILEAQVTEINCLACYIPRRVLRVSIFILPKVHHCISITLLTCCPSFQTSPFLIVCHEVCTCLLAYCTSCPAQTTFHFCKCKASPSPSPVFCFAYDSTAPPFFSLHDGDGSVLWMSGLGNGATIKTGLGGRK